MKGDLGILLKGSLKTYLGIFSLPMDKLPFEGSDTPDNGLTCNAQCGTVEILS